MMGNIQDEFTLSMRLKALLRCIGRHPFHFIAAIVALGMMIQLVIQLMYWIGRNAGGIPTDFPAGDVLAFWGSYFSFFGTLVLSVVTLIQNERLHQQNIRLEEQAFIATNAPMLIPTEDIPVWWRFSSTNNIKQSVENDVVLVDKNGVNSGRKFLLQGKLFFRVKDYVDAYKIDNIRIRFTGQYLSDVMVEFETEDEFKKVVWGGDKDNSSVLMVITSLYFGSYIWTQDIEDPELIKERDRLLLGDFEFQIEINLHLKNQGIISEHFCLISVWPKNRSQLSWKKVYIPQHKMRNNAIIRIKVPYLQEKNRE